MSRTLSALTLTLVVTAAVRADQPVPRNHVKKPDAYSLTLVITPAVRRAPEPEPTKEGKEPDAYVKVEAKGTLVTGIMAIGGETTGTLIKAGGTSLEVEFDAKNRAAVEKLKDKTVIITGMLYVKPGVTRGPRTIVKVTSIKEAKARR